MAKERKTNAKPGDTVELADKDTGFSDPETEFKIVRDQKVKLGERIGRKTNRAIVSGALLVVSSKSAKSEGEGEDGGGKAAATTSAKTSTAKKPTK